MRVKLDRYPGGVCKALTLSYDDGREQDRRLIAIMNEHGIKGTFHLNSGAFGKPGYIESGEVQQLFAGHEISVHTVTHPFLEQTPMERVITEIMDDRRVLEALAGYPVRGMSYPFGTFNDQVAALLPSLGIRYARTVASTGHFGIPANLHKWGPTCHHRDMLEQGEKFLAYQPRWDRLSLLYVWGHSYEFDNDSNWDKIESFCRMMSGKSDIWYATNMEIVDYLDALGRLEFAADESMVRNPSCLSVWVSVDGEPVELKPGVNRIASNA